MKEALIGLILAIGSALGIYTPEPPPPVDNLGLAVLTVPQGGTGASSFTTGECLKGNGTGAVTTGSCGGGGGTGAATTSFAATAPITLTTSASAITYGFSGLATSSQPASSNVLVSNGGAGVYGAATSSLTINSPLTTSGTAGALVGGTNLTIDIDDIKAADLDLTDITLNDFTNDANFITLTSLSGTFPIAYNSGTGAITFGGLSTSTAAVQGNLPYFSGVNTFANVATTTVSCSGNTTCTQFVAIGPSPITISSTGGGTGLSTTSPTANDQVLVYNSTGAGAAYSIATTSLSISGPFTIANPIGVLKNGAVTYTGLATTTAITQGNLLYSSGGAGVTSVATSSATCSGGTSCSAFTVVGSVAPTISSFSYPFPSNATTTALTFSATTTHTAAQIGSTAIGSNVLKVSPLTGLTVSNSESVGGILNMNIGTTDSIGAVFYGNSTGAQRLVSVVCDAETFTGNCFHVRGDATGASVVNVLGGPEGLGIVKIGSNDVGDADASGLSIDTSLAGFLGQGIFLKGNNTAKLLNIRNADNAEVLTFMPSGRLGLGVTSPSAAFVVGNTFFVATTTASTTIMGTFQFPTQAAASGNNCLQIDTAGAITKTGAACGAGGSGLSTSSPVSAGNVLVYSSAGAGSAFGAATSSLSVSGPFNVPSGASIIGSSGAITYYGLATSTALTGGRLLYSDGTKNVTDVATTTLAFSGPFTGASSLGSLVGGSNSTVTYTGLATTSQPASSNLLVSNGGAGVYGVATTSATCSGNTTCDAFTVIGASPITISSTGGGSGLSTTSPVSAGNLLVYSSTGAGAAFGVATSSLSISGPFVVPSSSIIGASGAITYTGLATTSQPSSSNVLTSNGGSGVYGTATTSLAFSGFPANLSGTLGALLGGANSTLTYWGLATTSALTQGQLLYNTTGGNGVASVATTSVTCTGTVTCGAFSVIGSSPVTIDGAAGGSSKWTDGGLSTYLTATTDDMHLGATATATAPFWFDVSATTTYIGNGGAGDSFTQYGPSGYEWITGFDDTDDGFHIASSTALGVSNALSINKSTLNTSIHSFSATSTTATSTIAGSLQFGTTAGDNRLKVNCNGRVWPSSNSVGGCVNLSNGTVNPAAALTLYTNFPSGATAPLFQTRVDDATFDFPGWRLDYDGTNDGLVIAATAAASNAISISNTGVDHTLNSAYTGSTANKGAGNFTSTNTAGSAFQVSGSGAAGLALIKGTINASGFDADSSMLSLDASVASYTGQGLFIDTSGGSASGKLLNIRGNGNEWLTLDAQGQLGIASSTPGANWGLSIATSTVVSGGQLAVNIASSSAQAATYTVNWNSGNTQRFILNQATNFVINATSSNPRDGAKYTLKICQDGTGSRTATFVTPGQLVWSSKGTTTIASAANSATLIGMIYDGRTQRYDILASTTMTNGRSCTP